ncbi:carbonic anhydrase [Oscillospiraceae bacterium N12]|jgi:carbonic anhydrase|uniref:Carbonic anhydrase n=1 Tax=Jilunia laotingensis TaxID=2763675 RepID=A0A926F8G6_9BACT|nr:carbonic anhydrase [Jilunia laotingensis]MBC8593770.1 carbonic anhydrase [Jilunia laotingensis]
MVEEILAFNEQFVEKKGYEKFITNKYPDKKLAILSCMDTRLTELLPAALGLKNGDAKIIKNAGAVISHPFGSVIRSLLVAIYELGVEEVLVIAHSDCGAHHMDSEEIIGRMLARGIREETIDMIRYCGIDFRSWLGGFDDTAESVKGTVDSIIHHPLIPGDIKVHGLIIDSLTGKLTRVV